MASNRLSQFAGNFVKGGIRPHLFQVEGQIGPFSDEKIPFLVKAAQLPASTIGLIEVPYRGRKIKVPGDRTFAEWTITVLADGDFDLRNKFEAWSNRIQTHRSNVSPDATPLTNTSDIFQDWQIFQLDRAGNRLKAYNFVGCWPSEVSAIDVNFETTDSLSEFTVTLQYTYWESNTTDSFVSGTAPGPQLGLAGGPAPGGD